MKRRINDLVLLAGAMFGSENLLHKETTVYLCISTNKIRLDSRTNVLYNNCVIYEKDRMLNV